MPATTLFATYVAELGAPLRREGHKTVSYGPAKARIAALAGKRDLAEAEVRCIFPDGTERLYAVLIKDGDLLHLRDVEGGDALIPSSNHAH